LGLKDRISAFLLPSAVQRFSVSCSFERYWLLASSCPSVCLSVCNAVHCGSLGIDVQV